MINSIPIRVIHKDSKILVVQTLACMDTDLELDKVQILIENQLGTLQSTSYGAFNLGLHVKDNPKLVLENRCRLMEALNQSVSVDGSDTKIQQIHWLNQVHGNTVLDIDLLSAATIQPSSADALLTNRKGHALAIMTADCVPIMLYCSESRRIAGIHAGWHGLANGIIAETIKSFKQDFPKFKMSSIQAWIGASISCDQYEVNTNVVDQLVCGTMDNFATDDNDLMKNQGKYLLNDKNIDILTQKITRPHSIQGKSWVDLPLLAKIQLESLGVNVLTEDVPCSYADTRYYSYRRATHEQQESGRMAMLIVKLS